jgi:hypothetical protein
MAAISLSIAHGVDGMKISDFTVGTLAPNAGDFEVRLNTTNANSKNISHFEMIRAIEAFIRALQQGGNHVNVVTLSGGAAPPPAGLMQEGYIDRR